MSLLVFGSINMDLVARTPHLPAPAETITGHEFFTAPGGKGGNQAVAATRLQTSTTLVGRVGKDGFGSELLQNLQAVGVNTSAVFVDDTVATGVAIIAVDDQAQNNIIYIPGANAKIDQVDIDRLGKHLSGTKVLLLQLEVPIEATIAAAQLAQQHGITVVLDPAPAQDLPKNLYTSIDIITPNEVEAAQLVGFPVKIKEDAFKATDVLISRGVKTVIIKMGALGVAFATSDGNKQFLPAFKVNAIDTVAAGDAFNGGLAAALIEGLSLPEAVRWGAATGALSATKAGAQPSMPTREEFNRFLEI